MLWVLIYTSAIMAILRFYAGPIVQNLDLLDYLASSAIACVGLAGSLCSYLEQP